ncbi:GntR family transcriptional regulator [Glaciihabitans arcticus]|uniref:GntR family transcriptional regulator n=1 Tax=Glaciihabitans arcticus TaxID=2668039 RepID=A0A4Q9GUT6_9MICO|nr:GntR family transcriptional regulator [Glaciihabitans arcticus]TBN57378.1 GntR family transcriptional regulator [Glaciihabitans arcticus]
MITVDDTNPTPPFEQIRAQIASLIAAGELAHGDRLPTVRQLATDLRLAPGTVARAYTELEGAGLVESRRGAGTRVTGHAAPVDHAAVFAVAAQAQGLSLAAALAAVKKVWVV